MLLLHGSMVGLAFRIRDPNISQKALLRPKVFMILNNNEPLWVKMVRDKYRGFHPWKFTDREYKKCSPIFKALRVTMYVIRDGMCKLFADGKGTTIWDDPWIFIFYTFILEAYFC